MADAPKSPSTDSRRDKAWSKAREALERGREGLLKVSRVGKIKFNTARMQRDRVTLYRTLGEETYRLCKSGRLVSPEIDGLIHEIDRLSERIDAQKIEMQEKARQSR
ncbi:MAG TPA: hypothetical protein VI895_04270 [Bdellovibrionota bacterium]|nr:hypothetical protein [Bdellovibrionota bacterium]